jgi:gamma-carbonic anhydrase
MAAAPFVLPYAGVFPSFAGAPPRAAPGAAVLGRVEVGRGLALGPRAVVRADGHYVRIGDDFRLGARGTVHIAHELYPTHIGSGVSAGPRAVIHACDVGDRCFLGPDAIILDGSRIAAGAAFAAGAVVFPRTELEGGWLYAGSPAKPVRRLEPGELERWHAEFRPGDPGGEPTEPRRGLRFVAATARLDGDIRAADGVGVWFGCELLAGERTIAIGTDTNVQDNTRIAAEARDVTIGDRVTIGHNVLMSDCVVGDECLVGIGARVAPGTVVERDVLLAAGAATAGGQVLESGWMYGGRPAAKLKPLDAARRAGMAAIWPTYCAYAAEYAAAQAR